MDNDIKTWLYDILSSINEIESYYTDTPKIFEIYENDLRTKRAVERNIEIIGEAMTRILKHDNKIEISNSRKIVDVRNRIIYGYDSVSDDYIFPIIENKESYEKNDAMRYLITSKHNKLANFHLKKMGTTMKLPFPLSFHLSRHTFA